jgi:hypothetical protein
MEVVHDAIVENKAIDAVERLEAVADAENCSKVAEVVGKTADALVVSDEDVAAADVMTVNVAYVQPHKHDATAEVEVEDQVAWRTLAVEKAAEVEHCTAPERTFVLEALMAGCMQNHTREGY